MPRSASRFLALAAVLSLSASALAEDPAPPAKPEPPKPEPAKLLELLKSKEASDRLAAAKDARSVQDDRLVAPLVGLLGDADAGVRRAAIDALGARESPETARKAASALASHLGRLGKKAGSEVEAEVIGTADALGTLAQPSTVDALLTGIDADTAPAVVKARLMAVANVPTAEAIEGLLEFLAKEGRGANDLQGHHCRAALKWATGESRGIDPDAWRSWWRDARKTFDFRAAAERRAKARAEQEEKERRRGGKKDGEEPK
jgi:hypothetical protein